MSGAAAGFSRPGGGRARTVGGRAGVGVRAAAAAGAAGGVASGPASVSGDGRTAARATPPPGQIHRRHRVGHLGASRLRVGQLRWRLARLHLVSTAASVRLRRRAAAVNSFGTGHCRQVAEDGNTVARIPGQVKLPRAPTQRNV